MKQNIRFVTYNEISEEYYQEELHPTSNNFRVASLIVTKDFLKLSGYNSFDKIVEVGAGKSIAAELISDMGFSLKNLIITDLHESMLKYSNAFIELGSKTKVIGAENIHTKFSNIDYVLSSLGDPYNVNGFWKSSYEALAIGGYCIFTTPSYEWAQKFRKEYQKKDNMHAHFLLKNGLEVRVPSFIYEERLQIEIANSAGFTFEKTQQVNLSQIHKKISPKLLMGSSENYPILTGYLFRKA
jgi:hypothetical protein